MYLGIIIPRVFGFQSRDRTSALRRQVECKRLSKRIVFFSLFFLLLMISGEMRMIPTEAQH